MNWDIFLLFKQYQTAFGIAQQLTGQMVSWNKLRHAHFLRTYKQVPTTNIKKVSFKISMWKLWSSELHALRTGLYRYLISGLSQVRGPGGHVPPPFHFLADQLTLSQPGGDTLSPPSITCPPDFLTLRRPCILSNLHCEKDLWKFSKA